MRIGLNLLHARPEIGGGWQYIANLLGGLADHGGNHEFIAFASPVSAGLVPPDRGFQTVLLRVPTASRVLRVLYENTVLSGIARRMQIDLMHWFSNTHAALSRTPSAVTVYDLLAFTPAAPWGPVKLGYLRSMIRSTVGSASLLLPISQATAGELRARLHASPDRMVVIPPVLPDAFQPPPAENVAALKRTLALPERYWLYVAHFYPHKNHATLIDACQLFAARGAGHQWPLVFRGDGEAGIADVRRQLAAKGLDRSAIFLPPLAEADLVCLYAGAGALVFPSTHEGFGIPVLEAMACGCPVIAGPLAAVRETAGEAVWTADPMSAGTLCDAMQALQCDADLVNRLRSLGCARARRFRADAVIPLLLEAYERAAGTRLAIVDEAAPRVLR